MALQDHFRPPLSVRRHWHAFHNAWATFEEARLELLHNASPVDGIDYSPTGSSEGWTAPMPTHTVPIAILTDTVEVLVFNREAGPTLTGAIKLVSPANHSAK